MALGEALFWVACMGVAFVGFLGLQLRYFAGTGLRLAIGDRVKTASRDEVAAIVAHAVGGRRLPAIDTAAHQAEVEHARTAFAGPLRQIQIGRQITVIVPFLLAVMLVAFRFWPSIG
ncbi:MAG: hypothetical protein AAF216_09845 [Pseudomonadota bacterium]